MLSLLTNPWKVGTIGLALMLAVTTGWGFRVDHLRASWEVKYTNLSAQAVSVTFAAQQAAKNPKLTWIEVPAQIQTLASSNLDLKSSIKDANAKYTAMNGQYLAAVKAGQDLRSQLSTAQAARAGVEAKLSLMAQTPGDRTSCPALLSQAQDALDLAYGSGL